jgi:hypothetical protein
MESRHSVLLQLPNTQKEEKKRKEKIKKAKMNHHLLSMQGKTQQQQRILNSDARVSRRNLVQFSIGKGGMMWM